MNLKVGGSATFTYDQKGNQTHRNGTREVWYNSFNKPTDINRLDAELDFTYGADLARYKQVRVVNGETITTHYIDKLYEVEKNSNGHETTKAYISDVAIITGGSERNIRYTLRDRLGSATTFTDDLGQATTYRHFDPFGKTMSGDWRELNPARMSENPEEDRFRLPTRRGFTDHEHLDEVELIHMNGRVYDYNVGRFMSVDPVVQSPGNSQSINPYSYVMNNPLAGTDPTGYCAAETGSKIKKCIDVDVKNADTGKVTTTSVNSKHSNYSGNVAGAASSILGNGFQVTSVSAKLKGGGSLSIQDQASTNGKNQTSEQTTGGLNTGGTGDPIVGGIDKGGKTDNAGLSNDPDTGRFSPASGQYLSDSGSVIGLQSSDTLGIKTMRDSAGNAYYINQKTGIAEREFSSENGGATQISPLSYLIGGIGFFKGLLTSTKGFLIGGITMRTPLVYLYRDLERWVSLAQIIGAFG